MHWWDYVDGLVHDCSISSALPMEILQFCTKPSMYILQTLVYHVVAVWVDKSIVID